MISFVFKGKYSLLVSMLAIFIVASPVFALMSSPNYQIEVDSINSGGSDISSSSNFNLSDSIGEVGTGQSSSDNYQMNGGYRQMDASFISITVPSDINMSPSIGGVTGGTANGNGVWNIKTDSPSGYTLYVKSSSSPAMVSGLSNFADYTPASIDVPDYNWGINSANSEFGFSPYNISSQAPKYKNSGIACNTGSSISDEKCWYNFSTSNEAIAVKNSSTAPAGEDTKINFRAEVNTSTGFQTAGTYIATIIVTAVSN